MVHGIQANADASMDSWYDVEVRPATGGRVYLVFVKKHQDGTKRAVGRWSRANRYVFVGQPNLFERIIGLTWEQKIQKKLNELRRYANKLNDEDAISNIHALRFSK